jgi:hypothetical protein
LAFAYLAPTGGHGIAKEARNATTNILVKGFRRWQTIRIGLCAGLISDADEPTLRSCTKKKARGAAIPVVIARCVLLAESLIYIAIAVVIDLITNFNQVGLCLGRTRPAESVRRTDPLAIGAHIRVRTITRDSHAKRLVDLPVTVVVYSITQGLNALIESQHTAVIANPVSIDTPGHIGLTARSIGET